MSPAERIAREAVESLGVRALGLALDALPDLARWLFVPDHEQTSLAQHVRGLLAERSASRAALDEIRGGDA